MKFVIEFLLQHYWKLVVIFFFINRFVIDVVAGRILGYNYTPIDVYIYIYKTSWNSIELIQYLISKDPGMTNQFENKF